MVPKFPGPWISRTGSVSNAAGGKPNPVNDGPSARTTTRLGTFPVIMKPPIPALSPVSTRMRVDRLTVCDAGVAVGVAVGVDVALAVAVAVSVGEAATVAVGV